MKRLTGRTILPASYPDSLSSPRYCSCVRATIGAVCAAASSSGKPRLAPNDSVEGPIPTRYTGGCGLCTGRGETETGGTLK